MSSQADKHKVKFTVHYMNPSREKIISNVSSTLSLTDVHEQIHADATQKFTLRDSEAISMSSIIITKGDSVLLTIKLYISEY